MNFLRSTRLALALTAAAGFSVANAATLDLDVNTTTAGIQDGIATAVNIAPGGSRTVDLLLTIGAAESLASVSGRVTFDTTQLNVTSSNATCQVNDALGRVSFLGSSLPAPQFPAGTQTLCTLTFTAEAAAPDGTVLDLVFPAANLDPPATTANPGRLTVAVVTAAGPTLTFAPNGGTVTSGTNITVTPSGGEAGGSSDYSCAVPAGVTVTNSAGTINTGGAAATLAVSCPAGTADASMTCTREGGSDVVFAVDCPSAPAPVLSSSPATGTALICNGAANSVQTTSVVISNTGNADMTGVSCSVTNTVGTSFALTTAPSATIAAGASSTATVTCTVPATGSPTSTGSLNCTTTAPAGGALAFPISSQVFVPSAVIPATSMWSKIGLIGLLAALGMLMVGFRRSH